MTTDTRGLGEDMLRATASWWTVTGVWALVTGAVAIAWPAATVFVLALLLGFYLVVGGVALASANLRNRRATPAWRWRVVLGFLATLAGLLTWAWPGVTVWALAVIFGVAFILTGIVEISTALTFRASLPDWGWMVANGVLASAAGMLALTWPGITAFALAILIGFYLIAYGVVALVAAVRIRRTAVRLHSSGSAAFHVDNLNAELRDVRHGHV